MLVSWATKNIRFPTEKLPYSQIYGTKVCTSYTKRRLYRKILIFDENAISGHFKIIKKKNRNKGCETCLTRYLQRLPSSLEMKISVP